MFDKNCHRDITNFCIMAINEHKLLRFGDSNKTKQLNFKTLELSRNFNSKKILTIFNF